VSETKPEPPSLETRCPTCNGLCTVTYPTVGEPVYDAKELAAERIVSLHQQLGKLQAERDSSVEQHRKMQQKLEHRTLAMGDVVRARDEWHRKWEAAEARIATLEQQLAATDQEAGR
jgi:septal ring factor EnvC (AmiA/AmiB activator)